MAAERLGKCWRNQMIDAAIAEPTPASAPATTGTA
jgi:hypothetical protein